MCGLLGKFTNWRQILRIFNAFHVKFNVYACTLCRNTLPIEAAEHEWLTPFDSTRFENVISGLNFEI